MELTASELRWLESSPQGLRACADYHSIQETYAYASDHKESGDYHHARMLQLQAEADRIEREAEARTS